MITRDDVAKAAHDAGASRRVFAEIQRRRVTNAAFSIADLWREVENSSGSPTPNCTVDDLKRAPFDAAAAQRVHAVIKHRRLTHSAFTYGDLWREFEPGAGTRNAPASTSQLPGNIRLVQTSAQASSPAARPVSTSDHRQGPHVSSPAQQAARILADMATGNGRPESLDRLEELAPQVESISGRSQLKDFLFSFRRHDRGFVAEEHAEGAASLLYGGLGDACKSIGLDRKAVAAAAKRIVKGDGPEAA